MPIPNVYSGRKDIRPSHSDHNYIWSHAETLDYDIDDAIQTKNRIYLKYIAQYHKLSTYNIAQIAAYRGELSVFKWAFKSFVIESPECIECISDVMYNIVKGGHYHLLEWLEKQDDIYNDLYFPGNDVYYDINRWGRLHQDIIDLPFNDKNNEWVFNIACQVNLYDHHYK